MSLLKYQQVWKRQPKSAVIKDIEEHLLGLNNKYCTCIDFICAKHGGNMIRWIIVLDLMVTIWVKISGLESRKSCFRFFAYFSAGCSLSAA